METDTVVDLTAADWQQQLVAVAIELLPEWADVRFEDASVVAISGGITNKLHRIDLPDREPVLVRVFGRKTELMIDRPKEHIIFSALGSCGAGPALLGRFKNGRLEQWLPSRPLAPEDLNNDEMRKQIAEALVDFHEREVPLPREPYLWTCLLPWMALVKDISFDDEPDKAALFERLDVDQLERELQWLQSVLPSELNENGKALIAATAAEEGEDSAVVAAMELLFRVRLAHRDLLAGNVLLLESSGSLMFIDYEYSAYDYVGFDLGNHFCEYGGFAADFMSAYPTPPAQQGFILPFCRAAAPDIVSKFDDSGRLPQLLTALSMWVDRFSLASHLQWALWAAVQAKYSPIDFDFMAYAVVRAEGYFRAKDMFFSSRLPTGEPEDDSAADCGKDEPLEGEVEAKPAAGGGGAAVAVEEASA